MQTALPEKASNPALLGIAVTQRFFPKLCDEFLVKQPQT